MAVNSAHALSVILKHIAMNGTATAILNFAETAARQKIAARNPFLRCRNKKVISISRATIMSL